uniref:Uncharacterized protein n=1 Tax=Podoviridae sp. cthVG1 TaxID=2827297 RepID=A0A8S5RAL6_9CAUD|nr:MAG TPA: hypothetical protein [Podoviridae sp. cthVG1]
MLDECFNGIICNVKVVVHSFCDGVNGIIQFTPYCFCITSCRHLQCPIANDLRLSLDPSNKRTP